MGNGNPGSTPVLVSALAYGILGFCAGFLFGALRELLLIPAFGGRMGHWLEFVPLVLVILATSLWLTRKWPPGSVLSALLVGITGVGVLLAFESTFALLILAMPLSEYLDSFNILKGRLFPFGLLIMAVAPAIFTRLQK